MDFDLDEKSVEASPLLQFRKWFSNAIMNNVQDVEAMILSTVNVRGKPSSRVVYMRELADDGLIFFTNYNSKKAQDISYNPDVSVNFFWQPLGRQIRIEGTVQKISASDSDDYFSLRDRSSRIGAWASSQSEELDSRSALLERYNTLVNIYEDQDVPRPEWWGGYKLIPNYFEFWLGRDSRLHDRISYKLDEDGKWVIRRLSP